MRHPVEHLPPEDDWSQVTDQKIRKRIQNRLAQRIFRSSTSQAIVYSVFVLTNTRGKYEAVCSTTRT